MARKNSGQHAYPTYNQAAKITARFGGENKLAELLNLSRVTVYRWQWKRPIGTDGLVPSRQVARIQELARREGILLRQEDWEPQKNSWEKDIEDDKARKEVKRLEEERKEAERQAALKAEAEAFRTALATIGRFSVKKQTGGDDVLFGTVTNGDVAEAIEAATKKEVDRRHITVPEIHRTGSYKVQIKLHPEVVAEINLEVASH